MTILTGICFGFCHSYQLAAEELRSGTIDAYLLIDASAALKDAESDALEWVDNAVVRRILRTGDRVWVWAVSDSPELLYRGTLHSDDDLEKLATLIRSIRSTEVQADYTAALHEAVKAEAQREDRTAIAFTLLVEGYGSSKERNMKLDSTREELLRYSRVDDHPGWKAISIGLGIDSRVKTAAASYMDYIDSLQRQVP